MRVKSILLLAAFLAATGLIATLLLNLEYKTELKEARTAAFNDGVHFVVKYAAENKLLRNPEDGTASFDHCFFVENIVIDQGPHIRFSGDGQSMIYCTVIGGSRWSDFSDDIWRKYKDEPIKPRATPISGIQPVGLFYLQNMSASNCVVHSWNVTTEKTETVSATKSP
jgi:hypothetical protein